MEPKNISEIIELIRQKEPGLFSKDPRVIVGRIKAVFRGFPEQEITAEGVIALLKKNPLNKRTKGLK